MNQAWLDFLRGCGARVQDNGIVSDFGNPGEELSATSAGTVLVPLTAYGLIRVAGEDATTFLQNLLTNDVKGLPRGGVQHNSLCSPKGRMLANFLMWRDDAGYVLQLATGLQPLIQRKLSMYVLRSKVKVSDAGTGLVPIGLAGPQAEEAVREVGGAAPEAAAPAAHYGAGTVLRLDARRFELLVPAEDAQQAWERLAAHTRPVGFPVWQRLDILAGWPLITEDTQEQFVPQMVNFELIGGVNFQKGCYPGQEIVARTQYLGKLKRRMYLAHVSASAQAGSELFSPDLPDQACGMVVNAAPAPAGGADILAVMQMSSAEGGEVHLGGPAGPRLEFGTLPYSLD